MFTYRNEIDKKKIINEQTIMLFSEEYKLITYEDGEQILRIYDKKAKMWGTLRFSKPENAILLEEIISHTVRQLSCVK